MINLSSIVVLFSLFDSFSVAVVVVAVEDCAGGDGSDDLAVAGFC